MTDTSTSARPTMLTREQVKDILHPPHRRGNPEPDVHGAFWTLQHHYLAALDRIEAQETEIGRLRGLWDRERERTDWLVEKLTPAIAYSDVDDEGVPYSDIGHAVMQIDIADFETFMTAVVDDGSGAALAAVADTQEEAGDA